MSTSTPDWAEMIKHEKYRDDSLADYETISWEQSLCEDYKLYSRAAHAMIWAKLTGTMWNEQEKKHAAILMQMRFDGRIGFPGGFIDKGPEEIVDGLNRELEEEIALDISKYPFQQSHHVISHINHSRQIFLHFYAQEVSLKDFHLIESSQHKADEWGMETFGTIRVPLFLFEGGHRGFPVFLTNQFAGNCKYQLIHTIQKMNIVPPVDFKDLMEKYLSYA